MNASLVEDFRDALQVGISLWLQSGLLLLLGLGAGWFLRRRGPELRAFVYQTTLAGVMLGMVLSVALAGHVQPVWAVRLGTPLGTPGTPAAQETSPARLGSPPPPAGEDTGTAGQMASPSEHGHPPRNGPLLAGPRQRGEEVARSSQTGRGEPEGFLAFLWLTVTTLLLLWLVLCQWHLTRLRRTASPMTVGPAAEALAQLSALRLVPAPRLFTSPHVRSPFLAGLWRPAIFLPAGWDADFDDATLHAVLAHELAHLQRRDCAWTLLLRLTTAVFWPQPLLWLLARQLDQAAEEACDLLALTPDCPPRRYADCLLRLADRALPGAAALTLGAGVVPVRSTLGRRIEALLDRRNPAMKAPSVRTRMALTCCAAATALLAVFLVSASDKPGIAQTQQAKAEQLTSVSNLRQIGLAFVEYAQSHDDRLPDANRWKDELLPFLLQGSRSDAERQERTRQLFHDPSAPAGQTWSYAFNRTLSGARLSTIKDLANVVVLFESTQGAENANDGGESLPHPGWHGGQVDVCCADGRVKSLRDTDVKTTLTFQPQSAAAVTRDTGVRVYYRMKGQTITSDRMAFNRSTKTITFSGHVQVKDDNGETIQASSLTLRLQGGSFVATKSATAVTRIPVVGRLYSSGPSHKPIADATVEFYPCGPMSELQVDTPSVTTDSAGEFHTYLYPGDNYLTVDDLKQGSISSRKIRYNPLDSAAGPIDITTLDVKGKKMGPLSPASYIVNLTVPSGFAVQSTPGPAANDYVPELVTNGVATPLPDLSRTR